VDLDAPHVTEVEQAGLGSHRAPAACAITRDPHAISELGRPVRPSVPAQLAETADPD
jgi:hypothetical protein